MNSVEVAAVLTAALMFVNLVWTIFWSIQVAKQVREIRNDEEIERIADRLARLEEFKDSMPKHVASREDVEKLHGRISEVRKELHDNTKEIGGISKVLEQIGKNVDLLTKVHMKE